MRSVIGGAVAALIAAVAWLALEHLAQQELGWLTIAVGLVTGCGVRLSTGASGEKLCQGSFGCHIGSRCYR